MKNSKQLTEEGLVRILKELHIATKEDILTSERRTKLRMGKMRNDLASRIAKLATSTPTNRQFDELSKKVEGGYAN